MMHQRFFYCPKCGRRLFYRNCGERERLTCSGCGYIFYENPIVGVAVIVLDGEGRLLLGRRSGSSYNGLWCIPCGYVEYDEEVFAAAVREFKEETGLDVKINGVFTVQSNFHNPEVHTVGIWFEAEVTGGELKAQGDLDRAEYFDLASPPPLAFPTDIAVIKMLKNLNRTK
ncbi:MAG: ADP-ribose pyrophosphatase [Pelotomaculum thermopropionicum]|uniref:ADP-ribose pyrophosphatase n=1 Tax=Pelotomaculum thermopropionicum TaxID=110500 RepID=A0A117M3W9_9FIRM|nr:MAG: ADP-ribose pyrophosphatase [Pelotomaculum thermopropionicum]